jgi:hemoglobin/transferrin/lactoferrin receptor protein
MRLKLLLFTALLLFIGFGVQAQTVQVIDSETLKPIDLLTIRSSNSDRGALTDSMGIADISSLKNEQLLIFNHPSYRERKFSFSTLQSMAFLVQMNPSVTMLDNVVVSASKWEQNKNEVPNKIVEITSEDIAFANPPTVADALALSGQVFIQKSQLGGGSPIIRGFAANSVLIVVDGVRMNNAIFRSGNLQNVINLDPNILQGSEVIFGPGSVMHGSDALGGVMDFHTKDPQFTNEFKTEVSGLSFLRYGSAAGEVTGHFQLNFGGPAFSSLTSVTYSRFGDLKTGNNRTDKFPDFGKRFEYIERLNDVDVVTPNDDVNKQTFSGYNQTNLMQKFKWRLKNSDLTYSGHLSSSSDIPRYDRLIQRTDAGDLQYAEWYYGPQNRQMHSMKLALFQPNKIFTEAKLTTSYQRMEESRNSRLFQDNIRTQRKEQVDVFAFNGDFDKEISEDKQLFYGVEFIVNEVKSTAESVDISTELISPASTRYPDGGSTYSSASLYASYKWKITPRVILNTGARFNYVSLNSQFVDKSFFNFPYDEIDLENSAFNGSIGLVYLPNPNSKLDFIFSTGFRAPNVDDVGKVFDSEPGNVIVPNPDLKPESSYNAEFGFTQNLNSKIKFQSVFYYTELRNAMVRRDFTFNGQDEIIYEGVLSQVQAEVNVGEAYIAGISANLLADLGSNMTFKGSVTYTKGEDTIENIPLRHVVPIFGELSLKYVTEKFKSEFFTRFSGGIAFEDLSPSEQNKPHLYTTDGALPWSTLNLRSSYKLNDYFDINLTIENILNTHYRPYSSGISAPGFNMIIALRSTF